MAALTVQVVPHAGVTPTLTASLGGISNNTAPCGSGLALMLVNGAAATCNIDVLVASNVSVDGLAVTTPGGAAGPAGRFTRPAPSGSVSFSPPVPSEVAGGVILRAGPAAP